MAAFLVRLDSRRRLGNMDRGEYVPEPVGLARIGGGDRAVVRLLRGEMGRSILELDPQAMVMRRIGSVECVPAKVFKPRADSYGVVDPLRIGSHSDFWWATDVHYELEDPDKENNGRAFGNAVCGIAHSGGQHGRRGHRPGEGGD